MYQKIKHIFRKHVRIFVDKHVFTSYNTHIQNKCLKEVFLMRSFIHIRFERPNYLKYAAIAAASIFFILMSVILYQNKSAREHGSRRAGEREECYVSIQVAPGETLWEISSRYYSSEYKSMKKYIRRIKYLNHMLDEEISAGAYLIVPYYASPKEHAGF